MSSPHQNAESASAAPDQLPPGTVVDCYQVRRLLGSGGFSYIYLAEDQDTRDEVVIKEYLPRKFARRDEHLHVHPKEPELQDNLNRGRKLFYQEARVLASLRHPNIVRVRNFFIAYNTAYLVMDYQRGQNLADYVKKRKGGLSTHLLMTLFPPLLDALELIHSRSLLHLDIKPSNIHVRPGGDPVLLDFGAVHRIPLPGTKQGGRVITPGFSPYEQYYPDGHVGPWSDVYAVGATMRTCIEGKPPPNAIERHARDTLSLAVVTFRKRYPRFLLEAMDWAMEMLPSARPQQAGMLRDALMQETGRPRGAQGRGFVDSSLERLDEP